MTQGEVRMEKWVEEIIRRTVAEHTASCPNVERIQRLEVRLSSLIAFMLGSGTLGGVAGGIIASLIGLRT